ncbi:PAS domain-containing protein [Flavobacterium sp. 7A]|uniref:PAS domain-containing protein n=1 Tax=Flavobacterium sp. 7A TaxID=2940571 RepID=UPI002225B9E4|nr:PAS domain-containing protein [Flavobacterium sp. 7A]MCW2118130.1 PAS domain S-box-containing protein [Flavobacterium sp. 7A]
MAGLKLNFDEDSFNRLFPFYIQINSKMEVLSFGKSLRKHCLNLQEKSLFNSEFIIRQPRIHLILFDKITNYTNKDVVIEHIQTKLTLRGQFEHIEDTLLFVGAPWFTSMNEVNEAGLSKKDFAHHNSTFDLLQFVNKVENTSKQLTEMLATINSQKNQFKKDQEELNRLSYVASANINGVVFTTLDGTISWCNDAFLSLTGHSRPEIIGKTPIQIGRIKDTDKAEITKMVNSFYAGDSFEVELLHAKKNDLPFWSRVKGQPIYDKKGNVTQYFAILEDISLKKKYDESLEIEKEKYRSIIANMNLGLLEVDLDDNITLANLSFIEMSGYSLEELLGNRAKTLLIDTESKEILESKQIMRTKGITDSYEVKALNKNRDSKTWLISGAPNYNIHGEIIGSIGIHLDITEQKEQKEQLYLLSLIAQKNINAVIICDAKGRIEWVNSSFLKMSGYAEEEVLNQNPGVLLQGKESAPETIAYLSEQLSKGLPFKCEIINYSKDKRKYWVRLQGQALYDKKGNITKFFAIEEDITSQKMLEQQKEGLINDLAKTNKELEEYAQIVSHDLKSPLRSINSLITWIKDENEGNFTNDTTKYFSLIESKVEKMDHLIEGILTYSKIDKEETRSESVNTNDIVSTIIDIIHIPDHIQVLIKNPMPIIKADRFRIQQLFQNLIGNAVNYIDKEKGLVEISSEEFDDCCIFSVKDNGEGIPKEIHSKIFETFKIFTTSKHSTGLGLSIVQKIVLFYKGQIWLESEVSVGTTFFIKLYK